MRYGFYLPTRGQTASPEALETLVARGEALGFSSVVIADHIVFPVTIKSRYPYTVSGAFPGQGDALEQLSLMAFLAGKTRSLRLISSVMILPHRNPVVTAKMLATIDVLSRGRVTVGVGVGWLREEFEALGTPDFDRRGAVSDEYLRIFKTLWTQDPASFRGEFYRFEAVRCLPRPVQRPHPPIWVGGHSPAALRRVARLGDGWHPVGANPAVPLRPAELRARLEDLYRLTEAENRDPSALTISYKAPIYDPGQGVGGAAERRPFSGSAQAITDDIAAFTRLGVSELIFDFRSENLAESLERMERFAPFIRQTAAV
jgi:probable F420-dependent oxidoreductase